MTTTASATAVSSSPMSAVELSRSVYLDVHYTGQLADILYDMTSGDVLEPARVEALALSIKLISDRVCAELDSVSRAEPAS